MSLIEIGFSLLELAWHSYIQRMHIAIIVPQIDVIVALELSGRCPSGTGEAKQMRIIIIETRGSGRCSAYVPQACTTAAVTGDQLASSCGRSSQSC